MKKKVLAFGLGLLVASVFFADCRPALSEDLKLDKPRIIKPDKTKKKVMIASWYGPGFYGKETADGTVLRRKTVGAAHRTAPLGAKVVVVNLLNNKSVVVPVIDRGPFEKEEGKYSRDIDLTHEAAKEIGMVGEGTVPVKIYLLHS